MRQNPFFDGFSFTAAFSLYTPDGRILLQHRTADAPTDPGRWGFFGGSVEEEETFREGLVREVREELGIDVSQIDVELVHSFLYRDIKKLTVLYAGPAIHSAEDLLASQAEGQGLRFFSEDEAASLDVSPADRTALPFLFQYVGRRVL